MVSRDSVQRKNGNKVRESDSLFLLRRKLTRTLWLLQESNQGRRKGVLFAVGMVEVYRIRTASYMGKKRIL